MNNSNNDAQNFANILLIHIRSIIAHTCNMFV